LAEIAIRRLPELLGCDYVCWNEHGGESLVYSRVYTSATHVAAIAPLQETIHQTLPTHPVVRGMHMGGSYKRLDGVYEMRDFFSHLEVKEAAIYRDAFRHVDAQYQLVTHFGFTGEFGVILSANCHRNFRETQRRILAVLRDHFSVACRCQQERRRQQQQFGRKFIDSLTQRESQTLQWVRQGKTNGEIAIILGISPRTVEKHVAAILEKLGYENRKALIAAFSLENS
jgi:DNA-binding CsgD family transcriptional regulator